MDLNALKAAKQAEGDDHIILDPPEATDGLKADGGSATGGGTDKPIEEDLAEPEPEPEPEMEDAEEAGIDKDAAAAGPGKIAEVFRAEQGAPGEDLNLEGSIQERQAAQMQTDQVQMQQVAQGIPMQQGGASYPVGGGAAVGVALASLVAAPFRVAGSVVEGFATHLSGFMERKGVAAPGGVTLTPAHAEMAIVDATLASKAVIDGAEAVRKHPGYAAWYRDLEAAARPGGKMVGDVIREMGETGAHSKLYAGFEKLRADEDFAKLHDDLIARMDVHRAKWEEAAVKVEAVGGRSEDLWHHLDSATAAIRTATQAIPAEQGMSLADRAKNILGGLKNFFCKVFRIAPKVEADAPRPSAPAA